MATRVAFYDLDGTLISGNVVTRYAFLVKNHPSRVRAVLKYAELLASVPVLIGLDLYSRRLFNEVFYRKYRGLDKAWLESMAERMFVEEVRPKIYAGAKALVEADRAAGYQVVLVTGGLDFDLPPLVRYFGFDHVIANRLVFADGRATGAVEPPLLAEQAKQEALRRFCRDYNVDMRQSKAYSDSYSDLPMLESVGWPAAANPDRRLRRVALARGWPILDLKKAEHGHTS